MTDTTIGIIIGSALTLLGVILQGVISGGLDYWKDARAEDRQKLAKREAAYLDFVNFYGAILVSLGVSAVSNNPAVNLVAANLYIQPRLLEKNSAVLTGVQLYGTPKIAALAASFIKDFHNQLKSGAITGFPITEFDNRLSAIIDEVRNELERGSKASG